MNDHSLSQYNEMLNKLSLHPQIEVIHAHNFKGNRSYNRNLGASHAQNPILVFVDGDIYFTAPILKKMQEHLKSSLCVAVYGNTYGHSGNIFIMNTILEIDYFKLLFDKEKWKELLQYPMLKDSREKKEADLLSGQFAWNYFYTSYCMTRKDIFFQIGGFDENFEEWGAEDVDLGYRLSQFGEIHYEKEAIAFHIPHPKNHHKNKITNRKNMYYMLGKYQKTIFEIKIAYNKSQKLFQSLNIFFSTMQKNETVMLNLPIEENNIYYNIVSQACPNGQVIYLGADSQEIHLELLGLSLPFKNKTFNKAFLQSYIFLYPVALATRILQEFIRISAKVFIVNQPAVHRIKWDIDVENAFRANSPFSDIYYFCKNYNDFIFDIETNNGLISVTPAFKFHEES